MAYTKQVWRDRGAEGEQTPINAERLGHIEDGVKSAVRGISTDNGTAVPNEATDYVNIVGGTAVLVTASGSEVVVNIQSGAISDSMLSGEVSIQHGGTGASSASAALANLGGAAKSHASLTTDHGGATSGMYGHVLLSDSTSDSSHDASDSIAATPAAVAAAMAAANQANALAQNVQGGSLTDGSIQSAALAQSCVTTAKVAAHSITQAKLSVELQQALGLTVV